MLLRGSGENQGLDYDLRAVSKEGFSSGVESGELLIEFANAVMSSGSERLDAARAAILERMGAKALVECAAIAANFNQMVRIADATGIPIDSMNGFLASKKMWILEQCLTWLLLPGFPH